jgi:hypothetical protein
VIIGLTGKRLSGKDTVANYLVEKHGFEHLFFSKVMKEAVAALFDIRVEDVDNYKGDRGGFEEVRVALNYRGIQMKDLGWVSFLQRFGTDMGRKVLGEDIWVDLVNESIENFNDNYVIKDVRFKNEAEWILLAGGKIIELRRDILDKANDNHESENGLPEDMAEYVIANTSTIESLYKDVDAVLENIYANRA